MTRLFSIGNNDNPDMFPYQERTKIPNRRAQILAVSYYRCTASDGSRVNQLHHHAVETLSHKSLEAEPFGPYIFLYLGLREHTLRCDHKMALAYRRRWHSRVLCVTTEVIDFIFELACLYR